MGSLYAYDRGGNVSYSSQQNLNRRPNKKNKRSAQINNFTAEVAISQ